MEEVKYKADKNKILDVEVKTVLQQENSKYINMYYRAEGTFVFSLVALLLAIFLWDEISDPLFYFLFTTFLNLLLMVFFLFRHFKAKRLI